MDTGFYDGASAKIIDMLLWKDVSVEENKTSASEPTTDVAQA